VDWGILFVAGLFEVAMALSLERSRNFARLGPSVLFAITGTASFLLLSRAMRTIPVGTAYAVWTGIGAFGTAVLGIVWLGDPASFWRVLFLATLIGSVIGLKAVSPH
jgi:quaternary ammonium compound-resistance protein SugE